MSTSPSLRDIPPYTPVKRVDVLVAAAKVERQALRFALGAAVAAALFSLLFVRSPTLPIAGALKSVSGYSLMFTLVIGLLVGPLAYWQGAMETNRAVTGARRHDFRWSIVPITLGLSVASTLAMMALWELFSRVFTNAVLERSFYLIVFVGIAGAATYVLYQALAHIDSLSLLYLSLLGIFGSFFFSALLHPNPYWWEFSFSHLGTAESDVRFLFNIGLVVTAVLLIAWQQFFMEDVMALQRHGLVSVRTQRFLRIMLIAMALGAGGTGAIRWGISPFLNVMHTVAASGFGIAVGLILASLPWTMPFQPRELLYASYTLLALVLLVVIFRVAGQISLVGMQMSATLLGSFWIIIFVRNTKLIVDRLEAEPER